MRNYDKTRMSYIGIVLMLISVLICAGCVTVGDKEDSSAIKIEAYAISAPIDAPEGELYIDEYPMWDTAKCNPFEDKNADRVKTIEFDGKEYTGEYWLSIVEMFNDYQSDYYECQEGWFSVNSKNGELSCIDFFESEVGEKTIDDCRDEAIRLAKQFIDVDKYELTAEANEYIISFRFRRRIGEYDTCAATSVAFYTSGKIAFVTSTMDKAVDRIFSEKSNEAIEKKVRDLCSKEAEKILGEKITSIYEDIYGYNLEDKWMVVLEDGDIGVVYRVDVDRMRVFEDGEACLQGELIFVLLREKGIAREQEVTKEDIAHTDRVISHKQEISREGYNYASFSETIKELYAEGNYVKGTLDIPMYPEEELLFDIDSGFELVRDAGIWSGTSAMPTASAGIIGRYPTNAIRLKDNGTTYTVYDTDSGYRLYLFFNENSNYLYPVGLPVVVKDVLSYDGFSHLKIGDSIECVEAIDSVATLHNRYMRDTFHLDPKASQGLKELGFPCTGIHYLKDGILRIEYDMLEDESLVISRVEFNEDYVLKDALGNDVDYRIEEIDLPKQ